MNRKLKISVLALLMMNQQSVLAKVTIEEAELLGNKLTRIGAEAAGNAAGTIPAYSGGIKAQTGVDVRANRFAQEQPLFVITNENINAHVDKLSAGQLALFKRYPDTFKMPVYASHRTASYPDSVQTKAVKNSTHAELIENGNGLINFDETIPFAIPKNGVEVIWNHISRYRGGSVERNRVVVPVQSDGNYNPVHVQAYQVFPLYLAEGYSQKDDENILFYYTSSIKSPARLTGNVLLVHETIDQIKQPRLAWEYNAGQRRVRRAPQVAYDAPVQGTEGLMTIDQTDMYNGAPNKYDWKLVGKTELYIPYNAYLLADTSRKYSEIIQAGHINSDLTRYELHRVWKVEATLKEGERHIYGQRTLYIDEDTWQVALADHYDKRGQLWRVAEGHMLQFTDANVPWYAATTNYDLFSGQSMVELSNEEKDAYKFGICKKRSDFTASALRRSGT